MKIYIAGPMTGLPDCNRPAFNAVASILTKCGETVLNPAVLPDGMEHHEYMTICLAMVEVADQVFLLPGWRESKGACMEHRKACELGKKIIEIELLTGGPV